MRSVALLLFGIYLAFADEYPFRITCKDETGSVGDEFGSVGEEFSLTCTFSDQEHVCCKKSNKFRQIASNDSSTICKGEFSTDPCVKMTNLSCFYTANSAMPITFLLFMEAECKSIRGVFTDDDIMYCLPAPDLASEEYTMVFFVLVAAGCVLLFIIFAAFMGVIVLLKSSQGKRLLKGCVSGSTTDADSVSDQEMQKYNSCASMDFPPSL